MIWIFHFPLIALNADTRADDSQYMPGTFDFILKYREPKFATSPLGVAINGALSQPSIEVCR